MKKNYLILVGLFIPLLLSAQEAASTSGGNIIGSGGSASYTVGQVVYLTNTGINGSIAQGVQQPFEISVVTDIRNVTNVNLLYSVYPNPTTDLLILKVEKYDKVNLSFQLLDIKGQLLENKKIISDETIISTKNFIPAIYFLKVNDNNKEVITFKIIKN